MNSKKLFSIVLVVFLVSMLGANIGAKTVTLKFIETTDVHGSFFPYDFINAKEVPTSLAQVYSYVKEQRANTDQHVILLDNGDILQGTRALLCQAGLPSVWWPLAAKCYCHHDNVAARP